MKKKKPSGQYNIDDFDIRILEILQSDASKSTSEIADMVGLSQSPCWKRINKLEELGYIERRVAVLNRQLLGLEVMALIQVKLSEPGRQMLGNFETRITRMPEVLDCYTILGEMDFVLLICVKNIEHLERFLKEGLWSISGIQEIRTNIILSQSQGGGKLPIQPEG